MATTPRSEPDPGPDRRADARRDVRPANSGPVLLALVGLACLAVVLGTGILALGLVGERTEGSSGHAVVHEGASGDGYAVWERNDDGTPVRWDACSPIPLVIDTDGAPRGFAQDLAEAIERLERASGLRLEVEASTEERPTGQRPPYQPERYGERWAPVLVAWAAPGESGLPLRDVDRGLALPVAMGPDGDRTYVTGQVVFNRDRADLRTGFDDRADSWGATILHELGHLVGLAHTDDQDELMATYPGEGPVRLGPGDRAGLRAVGAPAGCRATPPAGPVEVERRG
ncbi:MAG: matrixin family metalloprotease [Nitriliruptoraceae bacterium]|nr:matrixin family metalloprotease [Nitriliruptoraceae bacterium]